jgi:hypothetical protein
MKYSVSFHITMQLIISSYFVTCMSRMTLSGGMQKGGMNKISEHSERNGMSIHLKVIQVYFFKPPPIVMI